MATSQDIMLFRLQRIVGSTLAWRRGGHYYVPGAGIFGWNVMPEIYHLAHEALLSFAAALFGVPSLVYLDDSIYEQSTLTGSQPVRKFPGDHIGLL